jgi:subtilase family serine protease
MVRRSSRASRLSFDRLDARCLLSGGLLPYQMTHAYGVDRLVFNTTGGQIKADGSGQTIGLIEAYHDPNLFNDLKYFDRYFGLSDPAITQAWYTTQTNDGWASEELLDVEWAHVMAPGARILVVEARSNSNSDLLTAVDYARRQPGVSVVSMSYGGGESSGDTQFDGYYRTPAGHNGVTFVASTGDNGARPGAQSPATSPNVVAVGGTSLSYDSSGNYLGETAWSGSGGGYSYYESEPSYQYSLQRSGRRTVPDLAMDADPNTGAWVYYTTPSTGRSGWQVIGGTSLAAPLFAGMIAIIDQGRNLFGQGTLDGATQTLPAIYAISSGDFHDVTRGSNGYNAGQGYDLVTGRGSPIGLNFIRDLVNYGSAGNFASSSTARGTSSPIGSSFSVVPTSSLSAAATLPKIQVVVSRTFVPVSTPIGSPAASRAALVQDQARARLFDSAKAHL